MIYSRFIAANAVTLRKHASALEPNPRTPEPSRSRKGEAFLCQPTPPPALTHPALLTAGAHNFRYDALRAAFDDRSGHRLDAHDLVALSLMQELVRENPNYVRKGDTSVQRKRKAEHTHFEEIVEVALVSDLAEVNAKKKGE